MKYIAVTKETLEKMVNSFTDFEEYAEFYYELLILGAEINYNAEFIKRNAENEDALALALQKNRFSPRASI